MVEFAVCMPLLSILALGSVEVSNAIFLKQALVASAYAGACQSVKANSTTASTLSTAKSALEFRSIKNASITISTGTVEAVGRGQPITITVSAPISSNSTFIGHVMPHRVLSASTTMVKERLP